MTIIYRADVPHSCEIPRWKPDAVPYGSIVRCDCGRYWERRNTYEFWVKYWQPVCWWNWRAKRRIRVAERTEKQ